VSLNIRLLDAADWPQVEGLFEKGLLPGKPKKETTSGVVLTDGDKIVGFIGLYFIPLIENFYLDKKYRNQGWVDKMLRWLFSQASPQSGFYFFSKRPAEEKFCKKYGGEVKNYKVWEKRFK